MSVSAKQKRESRVRRHRRVRKKVQGTAQRPRLAVFRSNKHIAAQLRCSENTITNTIKRFHECGRDVEQTLLDVPEQTVELADSLGATTPQLVTRFLYPEARSGLVLSLTTVTISLISYSTIMGVVGGGGVGDFAIRYGYQTYEEEIMYLTILIMIVLVMLVQLLGSTIARGLDRRRR